MITLDAALLATIPLPAHDGEVDKDARGRVLVVGGSVGVPGGALLAGVAALRAGAGKLQIATVRSAAMMLALAVPEALVIGLDETRKGGIAKSAARTLRSYVSRCDTLLIGPGMSAGKQCRALVAALIEHECAASLVLDAGALDCVHEALRLRSGQAILTPHAGEMATLLGISRDEVQANPETVARDAAARVDGIVVLKGSTTLVATPGGELYRYQGGGVGLATSGSGDTLAGIVAGLAARGCEPLTAAVWGVFLHGEAGQRLAKSHGRVGFLARELLAEVPRVMAEHER